MAKDKTEKKQEQPVRLEVVIGGETYPAYLTNGALLRFKQQTGKELADSDGGFADTFTLLWCCVASACKREGVSFGMSLEEFADATDPGDIEEWSSSLFAASADDGTAGAGKKK